MKKNVLWVLLALLLMQTGCLRDASPVEGTTFAMDTVMNLTLYGGRDRDKTRETRDGMLLRLSWFEEKLSATRDDSDISRVNQGAGTPVEVDALTAQALEEALALCQVTGGALDITAFPAVKAWGFTTGEHRVPSAEELAELAASIDFRAVRLEENTVTLPAGMALDLGAVAKGFAGDQAATTARESGISSALIDLGQSTIVTVGAKPDGSPWRIGIQDPDADGYFAVVELADLAMGTSGGYQRFFEQDGVTYWHILDPETAAPARSGLTSVTVVAPSALTCDGLSTALFVMGLEEGVSFWRDHPELEFDALFLSEDGSIFLTAGLADRVSLAEGCQDREVTVLE